MSLSEVEESYSHIDLTADELREAIIWRKQKKEQELRAIELKQREEENRRKLTQTQFDYQQTKAFMLYRAEKLFDGKFRLDRFNEVIFDLLCLYFSNDIKFIAQSSALEIQNPSLEKGIFLAGNLGVGKTWIMKLFCKNNRQVYYLRNAKKIADEFEVDGEKAMAEYSAKYKNPVNDAASFYHPFAGLCIDDIGTEDLKMHFGNKKNVIGDIIEKRYATETVGLLLHGTTNWGADELKQFYGGRVISRMREIFNFIELPGNDRRK